MYSMICTRESFLMVLSCLNDSLLIKEKMKNSALSLPNLVDIMTFAFTIINYLFLDQNLLSVCKIRILQ